MQITPTDRLGSATQREEASSSESRTSETDVVSPNPVNPYAKETFFWLPFEQQIRLVFDESHQSLVQLQRMLECVALEAISVVTEPKEPPTVSIVIDEPAAPLLPSTLSSTRLSAATTPTRGRGSPFCIAFWCRKESQPPFLHFKHTRRKSLDVQQRHVYVPLCMHPKHTRHK